MMPRKILKCVGYGWCTAVVVCYIGVWLLSENGGGVFSRSGLGEIWLIAIACLPGAWMIKAGEKQASDQ
jgi:hypothetical protein